MEQPLTPTPRPRHRRHANPFTVRGPMAVPDWSVLFGRSAPLALDIGCGPGRFTCALAARYPQYNVLGVEIRAHLVADCNHRLADARLPHARALLANANLHLPALLPPQSVALIALNFPDPWYKKRHHKRRVMQADWLAAVVPSLIVGANLHLMTDYAPLAEQMRAILAAHPELRCSHGDAPFAAASTTGLSSEREVKHMQRGEPIYRMSFTYAPTPASVTPPAPDNGARVQHKAAERLVDPSQRC